MPDGGYVRVLERKIAAGRPAANPGEMTPAKAFSVALARAAERAAGLALRVVTVSIRDQTVEEILDSLPEPALLATLEGPGGGPGLAALGPGTVSALIEMLMLGRIGAASPPPRRPTRTDGAMLAGFIDGVLAELERCHEGAMTANGFADFRFGRQLSDARPLALILDAPRYAVLRAEVAFGDEAPGAGKAGRRGEVVLLAPVVGRAAVSVPPNATKSPVTADQPEAADWEKRLEQVVLCANAEVTAVLAQITLPLASILDLEAGQSLTLPDTAPGSVQLVGVDGRILSFCRLGQGNGRRAVRLAQDMPTDTIVAPPPVASRILPAEPESEQAHSAPPHPGVGSPAPPPAALDNLQRRSQDKALQGPDCADPPPGVGEVAAFA